VQDFDGCRDGLKTQTNLLTGQCTGSGQVMLRCRDQLESDKILNRLQTKGIKYKVSARGDVDKFGLSRDYSRGKINNFIDVEENPQNFQQEQLDA